jgi:hypothetical protein
MSLAIWTTPWSKEQIEEDIRCSEGSMMPPVFVGTN